MSWSLWRTSTAPRNSISSQVLRPLSEGPKMASWSPAEGLRAWRLFFRVIPPKNRFQPSINNIYLISDWRKRCYWVSRHRFFFRVRHVHRGGGRTGGVIYLRRASFFGPWWCFSQKWYPIPSRRNGPPTSAWWVKLAGVGQNGPPEEGPGRQGPHLQDSPRHWPRKIGSHGPRITADPRPHTPLWNKRITERVLLFGTQVPNQRGFLLLLGTLRDRAVQVDTLKNYYEEGTNQETSFRWYYELWSTGLLQVKEFQKVRKSQGMSEKTSKSQGIFKKLKLKFRNHPRPYIT